MQHSLFILLLMAQSGRYKQWANRRRLDIDKKEYFQEATSFWCHANRGEQSMRPEVIDVFWQKMSGRVSVVTSETFPLQRFWSIFFLVITRPYKKCKWPHKRLRFLYKDAQYHSGIQFWTLRKGKPTCEDIWISMTINSLNCHSHKSSWRMEA